MHPLSPPARCFGSLHHATFRWLLVLCTAIVLLPGEEVALATVSRSGTWTLDATAKGWQTTPGTNTSVTWIGTIATAGTHEVFLSLPAPATPPRELFLAMSGTQYHHPEVVYTVVAADGSHVVLVNTITRTVTAVDGTTLATPRVEDVSTGRLSLGTFTFAAGQAAQVHLAPNTWQLGDPATWGVDVLWAPDAAPVVALTQAAAILPPPHRVLVLATNPETKPDQDNAGSSSSWYNTYHGLGGATGMSSLKAWSRSPANARPYALTEAYDGGWFTPAVLATYDAVVLLYETPSLSSPQNDALTQYVQQGGGLVGVHSCVNEWHSTVAKLMGAFFVFHHDANYYWSTPRLAVLLNATTAGATHTSLVGMARAANPSNPQWACYDEWYIWENQDVAFGDVLLVNDNNFTTNGVRAASANFASEYHFPHPVTWQRNQAWWARITASQDTLALNNSIDPGQGRIWYTSLGHKEFGAPNTFDGDFSTDRTKSRVDRFVPRLPTVGAGPFTFFEHLDGGIAYAMGASEAPPVIGVPATSSPSTVIVP
jgi:Trehalose utilisation